MGVFDRWRTNRIDATVDAVFRRTRSRELVTKAQSLRELRRYDEALSVLAEARAFAPDYLPAISVQANTLRVAGRKGEARSLLETEIARAHSADPVPLVEWYAILAEMSYWDDKDTTSAIALFKRALAAPIPTALGETGAAVARASVWTSLAMLHLNERQPAEAIEAARQALQLDRDDARALRVLGVATVVEHAIVSLGSIASEDQPPTALLEALGALERVLREAPTDVVARTYAALACEHLVRTPYYQVREGEAQVFWMRAGRLFDELWAAAKDSEGVEQVLDEYGRGLALALQIEARGRGQVVHFTFKGFGEDGTPHLEMSE